MQGLGGRPSLGPRFSESCPSERRRERIPPIRRGLCCAPCRPGALCPPSRGSCPAASIIGRGQGCPGQMAAKSRLAGRLSGYSCRPHEYRASFPPAGLAGWIITMARCGRVSSVKLCPRKTEAPFQPPPPPPLRPCLQSLPTLRRQSKAFGAPPAAARRRGCRGGRGMAGGDCWAGWRRQWKVVGSAAVPAQLILASTSLTCSGGGGGVNRRSSCEGCLQRVQNMDMGRDERGDLEQGKSAEYWEKVGFTHTG